MNKFIPTLVVGAILATTTLGMAQDNKASKEGKRGPAIQQRVDTLAKELNLKDDQKTKLTALMEEQAKKIRALREDTSLSREQRQEKSRTIRQDYDKKVKEILTPEQFDKMQKVRAADAEKFKNRGKKKGETKN